MGLLGVLSGRDQPPRPYPATTMRHSKFQHCRIICVSLPMKQLKFCHDWVLCFSSYERVKTLPWLSSMRLLSYETVKTLSLLSYMRLPFFETFQTHHWQIAHKSRSYFSVLDIARKWRVPVTAFDWCTLYVFYQMRHFESMHVFLNILMCFWRTARIPVYELSF